jgi:hypothetical protein
MDIDDRKRAEEEIRRYAARMEVLAEVSRTFVEAGLSYQSVLNTVVQRTAEFIGDSCVITRTSEDGQRSFPVAFCHRDPKALVRCCRPTANGINPRGMAIVGAIPPGVASPALACSMPKW